MGVEGRDGDFWLGDYCKDEDGWIRQRKLLNTHLTSLMPAVAPRNSSVSLGGTSSSDLIL